MSVSLEALGAQLGLGSTIGSAQEVKPFILENNVELKDLWLGIKGGMEDFEMGTFSVIEGHLKACLTRANLADKRSLTQGEFNTFYLLASEVLEKNEGTFSRFNYKSRLLTNTKIRTALEVRAMQVSEGTMEFTTQHAVRVVENVDKYLHLNGSQDAWLSDQKSNLVQATSHLAARGGKLMAELSERVANNQLVVGISSDIEEISSAIQKASNLRKILDSTPVTPRQPVEFVPTRVIAPDISTSAVASPSPEVVISTPESRVLPTPAVRGNKRFSIGESLRGLNQKIEDNIQAVVGSTRGGLRWSLPAIRLSLPSLRSTLIAAALVPGAMALAGLSLGITAYFEDPSHFASVVFDGDPVYERDALNGVKAENLRVEKVVENGKEKLQWYQLLNISVGTNSAAPTMNDFKVETKQDAEGNSYYEWYAKDALGQFTVQLKDKDLKLTPPDRVKIESQEENGVRTYRLVKFLTPQEVAAISPSVSQARKQYQAEAARAFPFTQSSIARVYVAGKTASHFDFYVKTSNPDLTTDILAPVPEQDGNGRLTGRVLEPEHPRLKKWDDLIATLSPFSN